MNNIILQSDSYKASHWLQYPPGTKHVYSYIESREDERDFQVFFGLQAFLKEYLVKPITWQMIEEAEYIIRKHGEPFNKHGWATLMARYNGQLPVSIRALPEGSVVNNRTPLVTIENTDPDFAWLTSYLETALLRAVWYPTSVATISYKAKQIIAKYLKETGTPGLIPFKLHDFGARGVSSSESAMLGGMAHLVNFMGTDTMEALVGARRYYGESMAGFSIPAAEHSTMTILGREGEAKQMERMVDQFAGEGKLYACVSDSYDIYNAVENIWGGTLKEKVLKSGGTLVVRPDSGIPHAVVLDVVKALDKAFGSTVNEKGYKVLHPAVRVIQGDGINLASIWTILQHLAAHKYSADNVAFGMGGGLLQHVNRDTFKYAMKCSAAVVGDKWVDVFKDPVTDSGKRSKKGQFSVKRTATGYLTIPLDVTMEDDCLRLVYENGKLLVDDTLATIRARATHEHLR